MYFMRYYIMVLSISLIVFASLYKNTLISLQEPQFQTPPHGPQFKYPTTQRLPSPATPVQLDPYVKEHELQVKVGQEFTLDLPANRSTGFTHVITAIDKEYLKEIKQDYHLNPSDNNRVIAGMGGTEIFTFKALKKGVTTLEFSYERPWEKQTNAQKDIYSITID